MRRLLGLRHQAHDVIDELTSLVEEKHELRVQAWVDRLSKIESVKCAVLDADELRRRVARAVFDAVRGANRRLQSVCDRGIELARDALERNRSNSRRP